MLKIATLTLTILPCSRASYPRAAHSSFHQPQMYAIRIECRAFEPRNVHGLQRRRPWRKLQKIRPCCRKRLTDSTVNLSTIVVILSDDYQHRIGSQIECSNIFSEGWCVVSTWQRNILQLDYAIICISILIFFLLLKWWTRHKNSFSFQNFQIETLKCLFLYGSQNMRVVCQ